MPDIRIALAFLVAIFLCCNAPVQAHTAALYESSLHAKPQASLSFFEKIVFHAAKRKLRKALKRSREAWVEIPGDSTRPCGRIILQSGQRIDVELAEISATEVTYRPCGHPEGPVFVRPKREVLAVIASNGDELYSNLVPVDTSKAKLDNLAIASFVLGLIPVFGVGAVLAIVFGAISLGRIQRLPEKYKGKGLAITGLVLGLLVTLTLLIVLILLGM